MAFHLGICRSFGVASDIGDLEKAKGSNPRVMAWAGSITHILENIRSRGKRRRI
jgi:hypothetical protein